MPETRFRIQWPDGQQTDGYSPSSVIRKYFQPGQTLPVSEFLSQARTALNDASDRVKAVYGRPCGLAIGQIHELEAQAQKFQSTPQAEVTFLQYLDSP